jgi:hypothetical protein
MDAIDKNVCVVAVVVDQMMDLSIRTLKKFGLKQTFRRNDNRMTR